MKPRNPHCQSPALIIASFATAGFVTLGSYSAQAASDTWNVDAAGNWADNPSWTSAAPGSTSGTTNTDTATFGTIISAARIVTVDANRNIQNMDFAGNSSGYTLSGGNLLLTAGGTIQTSGGGTAHTDTINTAITLQGDYTFGGNSTTAGRGLTFSTLATITSAATSGVTNLTLNGTTTAANNLLSGIISNGTGTNTVAISKSGTGTWTLTGANTYSGGTTVSAGTLLVGNAAGAGTGTVTLSGGTFGASGAQTISNAVVATAATTTTLQGTGTLNLNGKLSGSGTLNIGSAGVALGNVAVNSTNSSNSAEFTGTLSVGGVLGFNSPNSANGADYYYNLSNAAVTFTAGGSTQWNAASGSTANNPGIAYINFGSLASGSGVGTLVGSSGGTGGTKGVRYVVGTLNTDTTFGGAINASSAGTSLTKVGMGTLILTGTNTYAGTTFGTFFLPATTIRGGTLQVGDGTSGSLAATGALTFLDTGKFNYQGVTTGSSQTLGALTFSQGAGTVQSTYGSSGSTSLTFSNLVARTAGATANFVVSGGANGSTNKMVFTQVAGGAPTTGALLDKGYHFGGSDFAAYDAGGYVRALNYGTDASAAALDTITASNHVKLTSSVAGQAGISLLTLNLSGNGTSWANSASQTLTLTGGGLIKSGGGTAATLSGGTGLTTGGSSELVVRTDTSGDSLDIQTNILSTSTGGLTKSGAGTLTLSASGNAYTGATRVNEGTLAISGTYGGSSAFTVNNNATLTVTGTLTSTAASPAMTVGNGSGNGVLNVNSGANVNLNIASGNTGLQISNSATGYDTGSGTVNVAGTLSTNGDIHVGLGGTQTGTLNISNGGIVNIGTTTLRWLQLGAFDEASGVVNLATGGALNLNFNSNIKFNPTNGSGTNVFNQNGNVTVWSGNATGTTGSATEGAVDMQTGTTSVVNNTYNLNGGTLLVNRVYSTNTNGTRTFNFNGGTLKAFSASAATFFNLGTGNSRANVRNGGAVIDTNGFNVTIAQPLLHSNISGDNATDGGLTKNSAGTLTLSATNTYNGATAVNAGKLLVSGSIGNSAVTVSNTGTTLASGANGTIGSSITINSGAILAAGDVNSVGKATIGSGASSLASGSIFSWDLASNNDTDNGTRGTHYDALDTGGTLTVNSGAIFRVVLGAGVIADSFWQSTQSWSNIFSGPLSGAFSNNLLQVVNSAGATYDQNALNPGSGYGFTINGSTLTWSAVPETSNALIGGLLGLALLRRRRK